jgi:hypothetical protein
MVEITESAGVRRAAAGAGEQIGDTVRRRALPRRRALR